MPFRMRHRAVFDPLSITHCLSLKAPRLTTPPSWNWAWPLHTTAATNVLSQSPSQSPVRHVWISAIRAIAVSDDALFTAFLSQHGAVALHRPHIHSRPTPITVPSQILPPESSTWCQSATSLAFFHIRHPPSAPIARTLLAVGYASGAISFFDPVTTDFLALSKPQDVPVRRLRYYPAFYPPSPSADAVYPTPNPNSGLFAIFAWSGTVARFPSDELANLLTTAPPAIDQHGAGWIIWNLTAQDAVLDAVVCGSAPSAICDFDPDPPSAPLRLAVAGLNPPIAAYSVTSDQAFSARAAAKRAASSVLSAARGFLFSRISQAADFPAALSEEARTAVTGIARHTASWTDDPSSLHAFSKLSDVRGSARKALNAGFQAGLQRGLLNKGSDTEDATNSSQSAYVKLGMQNKTETASSAVGLSVGGPQETNSRLTFSSSASIVQNDLRRQRSSLANEAVAATLTSSAKNMRVVERMAAAPPPCSLIATCDTLGRIFLQDPRDFCVLRVLKGYRDSVVAWLVNGGPILVIHAPRLDVVELHGPLEQKRREAFRVLPGSIIVQSTNHHVFCVFPDGRLFELTDSTDEENAAVSSIDKKDQITNNARPHSHAPIIKDMHDDATLHDAEGLAPDYELTGAFVEAVKSGRASRAVEFLQQVGDDAFKVTHLMATLVACTTNVRSEVHVALSSKAAQIATKIRNPDLVCRFDAHRRLSEGFGLVAVDPIPLDSTTAGARLSKYGPRLLEDDLGSGLAEFGVDELTGNSKAARIAGRRMRTGASEMEQVTCERFILSHCLVPTIDLQTDMEYEIHPRSDLSEGEQIWLSKAYFMKLLEIDSVDVPTAGREHPTTADIFLALDKCISLSVEEITRQFLKFFLHMPLIPLLNTHVSIYASPLRCAVARIRSQYSRDIVDPIILDTCETTDRVANAVLLMRLCAIHEDDSTAESSNPYVQSLDRLDEVLLYRKLIAGSRVPNEIAESFTARRCTGVPGDAERHALTYLIEVDEYDRARKILVGSQSSRNLQDLAWHEAASVSEAALCECRKKAVALIGNVSEQIIPTNVISWIKEAKDVKEDVTSLSKQERVTRYRKIRGILLAAHAFIPDSSVDAVRSLQLAEAMSALIQLDSKTDASCDTRTENNTADQEEREQEETHESTMDKHVIDLILTGTDIDKVGNNDRDSEVSVSVDVGQDVPNLGMDEMGIEHETKDMMDVSDVAEKSDRERDENEMIEKNGVE